MKKILVAIEDRQYEWLKRLKRDGKIRAVNVYIRKLIAKEREDVIKNGKRKV